MTRFIFVDVEASGKSPFSGVMTEFGAVEYDHKHAFHGMLWQATPSVENPAIPEVLPGAVHYDEGATMRGFIAWLDKFEERVVFVSDNPAYDYQWINYYFDKHSLNNPFGHSARRIGDFYAGLTNNWRKTSDWKRYRVTKHTHHPVDDAMGNVEAVHKLVELFNLGKL
jgi:hypothetical protein